jgi:GNAT superfamily N-acetyltransferase
VPEHRIRRATEADAGDAARLLFDFNTEFDEPTPPRTELAVRVQQLLDAGDTAILLGGEGPDAIAVMRFRLALWSPAKECYLAELYVAPERRGEGLGAAMLEAVIEL